MKKITVLTLITVLLLTIVAGCAGGDKDENQGAAGGGDKKVTLKIFQFKVEIAEALSRLKKDYEAEHPNVKLSIETVGGGADYGAALKAKIAGGDEPDIFNNGGYSSLDLYMDRAEDLTGEPWVANVVDLAKAPMTKDGKLYGMPMNLEGYGFIYNKDLFKKAGITAAPTTLSELEAAAKKLKAAGITPFSNGYSEWWILGIHNLNVAVAQQPNPDQFIKDLRAGKASFKGNDVLNDWVKLLDLTVKYGQKNPLTTDYNTQVTNFANGQAAMMQQGNWTQVQIDKINPKLNLGLLPMPINNDAAKSGNIYVGVPNNWVVNKKSNNKKEAKQFLNWLVSSETGKRYITKEFKFIPAFTNISADPDDLGDIAAAIQEYKKDGKTLSWNWDKFPDGSTQEFGATIQAYLAGNINKNKMFEEFDKTVANLQKK